MQMAHKLLTWLATLAGAACLALLPAVLDQAIDLPPVVQDLITPYTTWVWLHAGVWAGGELTPWCVGGGLLTLVALILRAALPTFLGRAQAEAPPAETVQERLEALSVIADSSPERFADARQRLQALASAASPDVVAFFAEVIHAGFSLGASDVHILPERTRTSIRFRIDGVLKELVSIPQDWSAALVNRVKVLASLSIDTRARPQDGAIETGRADCTLRVSTMPTSHGEKVALRLAFYADERYDLTGLGFDDATLADLHELLGREHGLVFLAGPTGSGKTTTMYAALRHIHQARRGRANIVTLEDPVEVDLPEIVQTRVDPAAGLTFASGLRSLLRQDPDVIMVGEIRDEETATIALRAGLTGHLLLTSVHADSTAGVFARLLQLKVEPAQLASASLMILNQRLAFRNCPACAEVVEPGPKHEAVLARLEEAAPNVVGKGCEACAGTGFAGRVALFEMMRVSGPVRDLVARGAPTYEIIEAARAAGMDTLHERALALARDGVLSLDEVARALALT